MLGRADTQIIEMFLYNIGGIDFSDAALGITYTITLKRHLFVWGMKNYF